MNYNLGEETLTKFIDEINVDSDVVLIDINNENLHTGTVKPYQFPHRHDLNCYYANKVIEASEHKGITTIKIDCNKY